MVLMAPRLTESAISLKVPYTNNLIVDIINEEGNYVSVGIADKLTIKSPRLIPFDDFYKEVHGLVTSVTFGFDEKDFEDLVYGLKMDLEAYFYDVVEKPLSKR